MASNSYQAVVAGRVREDEGIAFVRQNKVATPSGAWAIASVGGKKQPTVDTQALQDEAVGKKDGRSPVKSAYNPTGNNVG